MSASVEVAGAGRAIRTERAIGCGGTVIGAGGPGVLPSRLLPRGPAGPAPGSRSPRTRMDSLLAGGSISSPAPKDLNREKILTASAPRLIPFLCLGTWNAELATEICRQSQA